MINPGESVTLTGTFTDAGSADRHSVLIRWGDSTDHTMIDLDAGQYSFTATHTYTETPAPVSRPS